MARRSLSLSLAFGVALTGCTGRGDDSNRSRRLSVVASGPTGRVHRAYPNGHPLSTVSAEAELLRVEDEVHRLVNDHRISIGLDALMPHEGLRRAARAHSMHMVVHSFFGHFNPEGDDPAQRLVRNGLALDGAGENIAAGYPDAASTVQGWLESPAHRVNMEDPRWSHAGAGHWLGGVYGYYTTQKFAIKPQ